MREFLYSALDVAAIISSMELGCRDENEMIDSIWNGEKSFLVLNIEIINVNSF